MLIREFIIGFEDGEIVLCSIAAEHISPFAELCSIPTCHTSIIYALTRIGDDARGINADYLAIALTFWTCTHGGVEGEHIVVGCLKLYSVGLETGGEIIGYHRWHEHQATFSPTLIEGGLGGVHHAGYAINREIH